LLRSLVAHIPPNYVVDEGSHMLRAAQPLISRSYTTLGRRFTAK
jgi:hypothetical protein